ncbi:hypothetical protein HACA111877_14265 [Halomonas casei]
MNSDGVTFMTFQTEPNGGPWGMVAATLLLK